MITDFATTAGLTEAWLAATLDCLQIIELDGSIRCINDVGLRLMAVESDSLEGVHWASLWSTGHQSVATAALADALCDGSARFSAPRTTPRGLQSWWNVVVTLMRDESGAPAHFLAVCRDVTHLIMGAKQHEEHIRYFESAFQHAAIGEALVGVDGRFLQVNPALCRLVGYDETVLLALDFQSITHPDDLPGDLGLLAQLAAGEIGSYRVEKRYLRGDGAYTWIDLNVSVVRHPDGSPNYYIAQIQDLTARKEAEEALGRSETSFKRLADDMRDLVVRVGDEGTLTYVSPASVTMLGYTPEEMLGRVMMDFVLPEDRKRCQQVWNTMVAGRVENTTVEYRVVRRDGTTIWCEASPTIEYDRKTGALCGAIDILRDVTERRALMTELKSAKAEAEAAAAVKSEFLANMSHELRTPLTSIVGFTRLTLDRPELSELTRTYVARVADASQALLATVNDVLDFSKLEAGQVTFQPQPTSLYELARGALDLFAPQAGAKDLVLSLEGVSRDADVWVMVDGNRLRQILLNLVGNAVKFTPDGAVTVRAIYDDQGQRLRVEVADTGPGVPDDKRNRLFQRFSQVDGSLTRSAGGTGLGLAICKGLVEAMGGVIGIDTELGVGSRFWFEMPAAPCADLEAGDASEDEDVAGLLPGLQVLVVDDHEGNRDLARLFLSGVGAEVELAVDGADALRVCAARAFDVIVMDVRMPRMDGPTALSRLRAEPGPNRETPVLAFTADAGDESLHRLLAHGFDGVVAKPLSPGDLIGAVARAAAEMMDEFEASGAA